MKWRRQFSGQVSLEDAHKRADKLLKSYRYHEVAQKTHLVYERGQQAAWLYAVRPRTYLTSLHLWSEEMADHCTFVVEVETTTMTNSFPTQGRKLIDAELDDLMAAILSNKLPTVNRATQNRTAGYTQFVLILLLLAISFAVGKFLLQVNLPIAIVAFVVTFAILFNVFNYVRLPGLPFPEYPIHNPPGAELVHKDAEGTVPVAPRKR